jgi:hypothetical protein
VAVDIGDDSEHLVEMQGNRVERWAASTPVTNTDEEAPRPPKPDVGQRVRQLMRDAGISGKEAVVGISGLYSVTRVVKMPQLTAAEALQAIPKMVSNLFPIDGLSMRWQLVPGDEVFHRALVLGVPNTTVTDNTASLDAAGIRPKALELRAIALTRVVNREQALIINVDTETLDVVVVSDGIPQIMRTVTMTLEQAEEELVSQMSAALHRAVVFFGQNNPDGPLPSNTPLFITGSRSEDPELPDKVATEVEFPVGEIEPPIDCPPHFPVRTFAAALGLALGQLSSRSLRSMETEALSINLLPVKTNPWRLTWARAVNLFAMLAGLALVVGLFGQIDDLNKEKDSLQSRMFALQNQLKVRQAEINRIQEMEEGIAAIEQLKNRRGDVRQVVSVVEDTLGADAPVTNYRITSGEVEIALQMEDVEMALEFVETLRAEGWEVSYPTLLNTLSPVIGLAALKESAQ